MMLKFQEWDQLNEASIFQKIGSWLERAFGTTYSNLHKLLNEYKELETHFVSEWEDVQIELDKLELQREQTKSDPAELKKLQRYITRNKDLLANMQKLHEKNVDYHMKKVKKAIGDEQKLKNYWELNKAKVDAEIAEDMYKASKKLADERLSDSLYKKYKDAVLTAKQRDSDFREKYGELARTQPREDLSRRPNNGGFQETHMSQYIAMGLQDFAQFVQKLEPRDAKRLSIALTEERNSLYLAMDLERDKLNDEIAKGSVNRDDASKRIKSIREKYMEKIRELRTKITLAKRNA